LTGEAEYVELFPGEWTNVFGDGDAIDWMALTGE